MRKHKIIDAIFFYDEIEMLYFRLSELDEYVDEFIIMECEIDFKGNPKPSNYKNNIDLFKKWEHKITYLLTPNLKYEDISPLFELISFTNKFNKTDLNSVGKDDIRFFQLTTLIGMLLEKPLGFDDLILISDVDEIPELSKTSSFKPYLKFGVIVLRQTNFIWSTKYVDVIPNMGTVGFQFSRLITDTEIIYKSYFNKSIPLSFEFQIIDNGYHFSHFYNLDRTISKLELLHDENCEYTLTEIKDKVKFSYKNLISIKTNRNEKNYNLIEYDGGLPKNIQLITNQEIGRDWSKKNLIIFDNENSVNLSEIDESYDNVCIINFTTNTKLPYEFQLEEKIIRYNILKPFEIYYQVDDVSDLKTFQKVFCTNDVKKIIYDLLPLNHDLITFLNNEKSSNTIVYSWGEIKTKHIYELVKDIL